LERDEIPTFAPLGATEGKPFLQHVFFLPEWIHIRDWLSSSDDAKRRSREANEQIANLKRKPRSKNRCGGGKELLISYTNLAEMHFTDDDYTKYNTVMKLPLRKWGNSLGIRIPKMFAVALNIREGEELDVRLDQNTIVLSSPNASLDVLLQRITNENLHDETDTGMRTGREVW